MSIWAVGFESEYRDDSLRCRPGNKVCGRVCIPQEQTCGGKRRIGLNTPAKILGSVAAASLLASGVSHALRKKGAPSMYAKAPMSVEEAKKRSAAFRESLQKAQATHEASMQKAEQAIRNANKAARQHSQDRKPRLTREFERQWNDPNHVWEL